MGTLALAVPHTIRQQWGPSHAEEDRFEQASGAVLRLGGWANHPFQRALSMYAVPVEWLSLDHSTTAESCKLSAKPVAPRQSALTSETRRDGAVDPPVWQTGSWSCWGRTAAVEQLAAEKLQSYSGCSRSAAHVTTPM